RMSVEVLPPDINKSDIGFTVEDGKVRFGLLAIKNVGSRPIEEILATRQSGGRFVSLADLCARVDSRAVTRSALECLIKVGALDDLAKGARHQLLESLDHAISIGQQQRKMQEIGQGSLFGGMDGHDPVKDFKLRNAPPIPHQQLLAWEKELLSIYLTAHPLARISEKLKAAGATPTSMLSEEWAGQKITIGGRLIEARRITTKKGDIMAAAIVEDIHGQVEVTIFPRTYGETAELWQDDNILLITGKVELRDDTPKIIVDSAERFEVSEEELSRPKYLLRITVARTGNDTIDTIHVQDAYRAIERYSGGDQYEVIVRNGSWQARLLPDDNHVGYCAELHAALEKALGPGSVQVSTLVEREPMLAGASATAGAGEYEAAFDEE
ncbi:MAG TPA: OB-fold nucleic acid binding domain-containing protein, partial [Ktedonobacterales bacterium]